MANKLPIPIVSSRTPIRDLAVMLNIDQLKACISDLKLYEILNHIQDDIIVSSSTAKHVNNQEFL